MGQWGAIKKAINSDLSKPLNQLIGKNTDTAGTTTLFAWFAKIWAELTPRLHTIFGTFSSTDADANWKTALSLSGPGILDFLYVAIPGGGNNGYIELVVDGVTFMSETAPGVLGVQRPIISPWGDTGSSATDFSPLGIAFNTSLVFRMRKNSAWSGTISAKWIVRVKS